MASLCVQAVETPERASTSVMDALASVSCGEEDVSSQRFQDDSLWILARSNVISRKARVEGPANVSMAGDSVVRAGAVVRGDLARIRVGRYTDARLSGVRPPHLISSRERCHA